MRRRCADVNIKTLRNGEILADVLQMMGVGSSKRERSLKKLQKLNVKYKRRPSC